MITPELRALGHQKFARSLQDLQLSARSHDLCCAQAMEELYSELARRYAGSHVRVAKFQADIERDFSSEKFGLRTFPTIVILPAGQAGYIKYPSETRDADTLDMWVRTVAGYQ